MNTVPDSIWTVQQSEFSDLSSVKQITKAMLRLITASVLGGFLGDELEMIGKPAALRVHMLGVLENAIFIVFPQQVLMSPKEVWRVSQELIAEFGFLVASAIMIDQHRDNETGLAIPASIWITVAIGITLDMRFEATAVLSALITLIALSILVLLTCFLKRSKD